MKKNLLIIISLYFVLTVFSYGAASSGGNEYSNYDKSAKLIKAAKKYEQKGKIDKAKKRYEKAFKLLLISNKKIPNNADTLNYLGFAARKLEYFEKAENYYLEGLAIEPTHAGINEYLGELYVATNRIDLAMERLEVLKNCNCEEYNELKEVIENN